MKALVNLTMLIAIVALLAGGALACSGTKTTPAPAAAAPTAVPPPAPTQVPVVPPPAPQPTFPPPPPALPSATAVRQAPPPAPAAPTQPPVAQPTAVPPTAQPAPASRSLNWKPIPPDKLYNFPNAIMVRESNYYSGAEAFYRIQGSSNGLKFGVDAVQKGANRDGWYADGATESDALSELYKLIMADLNGNMPGVRAWMQLECSDKQAQLDAARLADYEIHDFDSTGKSPNWFVRVTTSSPPEAFLTCKGQQGKGQPSASANPAPSVNAGMPKSCDATGVPVLPGNTVPKGTRVVARGVYWATLTSFIVAGEAPMDLTAGSGILGPNTALDIWMCYGNDFAAQFAAAGQLQNDKLHGIGGFPFTVRSGTWADLK